MISVPVTALFAAVFGLALLPLTVQVGMKRLAAGIYFGDGGDRALARRRAAQGNFVQYVPFALLLMLLCELSGASPWLLCSAGASLMLGRALHAWCMLATDGLGNARAAGMGLTFIAFLLLAGWLAMDQAGALMR